MALSISSVKKAYNVFTEIKINIIYDLNIPSKPIDIAEWNNEERQYPLERKVYGFGKKPDNGWESLFFLVSNPSQDLKDRFFELKGAVPNSSISKVYRDDNTNVWIFGWF
jgi:hypothetical protein